MTGYFRKFISLFASLTIPLNKFLKKTLNFSGHCNASQLLSTLRKHYVKNLYFIFLIQTSQTTYLLTMHTLESSLRQLKVLMT